MTGDTARQLVGVCRVCGERVPLLSDGVVRVHLDDVVARWGRDVCPGSAKAPRSER